MARRTGKAALSCMQRGARKLVFGALVGFACTGAARAEPPKDRAAPPPAPHYELTVAIKAVRYEARDAGAACGGGGNPHGAYLCSVTGRVLGVHRRHDERVSVGEQVHFSVYCRKDEAPLPPPCFGHHVEPGQQVRVALRRQDEGLRACGAWRVVGHLQSGPDADSVRRADAEAGARAATLGPPPPALACRVQARGLRVQLSWGPPVGPVFRRRDGSNFARLRVEDASGGPSARCELDFVDARHVAQPGFPRYVFEFSGARCTDMRALIREPVHELVSLIYYPEQGGRATLFWSAVAPVDECDHVDIGRAAIEAAQKNRVE